ncbi:UDP-glucose 4-epimerase [Brevundimonas bullata]|uniref:UDP-glucose 4-epimerase n=1 Tax=Brevundimonas bullata TaxID=13160 RepID=A0A7W7IQ83_9CAUL|nr:UDP-glucose 4-epimerase GalE [Brevundimonas bullata]MBB4798267.1 UDP-glucose 4-epimerase [Brevundimonas bullata]MBB6383419.1 UDP-glucose 4-epimerase [Brevundimonas bullata]
MNKKLKILLTGGAGYIGSHVLLRCLEAGYEVIVLDNLENSSRESVRRVEHLTGRVVHFCLGDIRDAENLDRIFTEHQVDAVMHFAGLKAIGESLAEPLRYYDTNVNGSVTLCAAMARAGVFRLVFSSTASVYGNQTEMPLNESSPRGSPASPYGWSKLMVEQILEDLASSDPRWSIGTLRYFNPVGAHPSGQIGEDSQGEPSNLVPYIAQVASGRRKHLSVYGNDYPTTDGTGVRDYIHVLDLADGHLAAMDRLTQSTGYKLWNLGTGQGFSVQEVIRGFEQACGQSIPHRFVPRRPGDVAQSWADPALARSELGWQSKLGLDDMLADHWRWQKMNPTGYTKK